MDLRFNHKYFSYKRLLILLLLLSLGMQLIVLSQIYFDKLEIINHPLRLVLRFFRGFSLSFVAGILFIYPTLIVIRNLNLRLPWKENVVKRVFIQFSFAVASGIIVTPIILFLANLIFSMELDFKIFLNNAYYLIVFCLFLTIILEALVYFDENTSSKQRAEKLEKELSQIRFEILKSQINPHFMFNSLNVLSGLVSKDVNKAQQFIDEFSSIYRYVLETIEQQVSTLSRELDFMRSYLFLQQLRYGESLKFSVNIPADNLQLFLPPLSLQVVLENAIKHNIINESNPLQIDIYCEGMILLVKNNLQSKISSVKSTGLGLTNLKKRYSLICKTVPTFNIEDSYYIAKLPLINTESDESIDY